MLLIFSPCLKNIQIKKLLFFKNLCFLVQSRFTLYLLWRIEMIFNKIYDIIILHVKNNSFHQFYSATMN